MALQLLYYSKIKVSPDFTNNFIELLTRCFEHSWEGEFFYLHLLLACRRVERLIGLAGELMWLDGWNALPWVLVYFEYVRCYFQYEHNSRPYSAIMFILKIRFPPAKSLATIFAVNIISVWCCSFRLYFSCEYMMGTLICLYCVVVFTVESIPPLLKFTRRNCTTELA